MVDQNHVEYLMRGNLIYVARLVQRYVRESGKKCFTYRGLRAFWSKNKLYKESEWHTIERKIRKMCERGLLKRIVVKKGFVVFCPTQLFWDCLYALDMLKS
ncbi:hypothetical protein DRN86_03575 [Candidatus Geothermarchaeota archaeon]|nr:MAG: hypothetical protein DRN86_03575 [Candidatus Geothermarchaeota archaeon]